MILIAAIIGVFLVIVSTVSYFLFIQKSASGPEYKSGINNATSADTANQVTDSYSGWSTYTNDTYKFSFRHPSDWGVTENKMNDCSTIVSEVAQPCTEIIVMDPMKNTLDIKVASRMDISSFSGAAGDISKKGELSFLGQTITLDVLTFDGKEKEILYNNTRTVTVGDTSYLLKLTSDESSSDYAAKELSTDAQETASKIIESFKSL